MLHGLNQGASLRLQREYAQGYIRGLLGSEAESQLHDTTAQPVALSPRSKGHPRKSAGFLYPHHPIDAIPRIPSREVSSSLQSVPRIGAGHTEPAFLQPQYRLRHRVALRTRRPGAFCRAQTSSCYTAVRLSPDSIPAAKSVSPCERRLPPMATATPVQVTPERIMRIAWGYVPPLVLEAAIRGAKSNGLYRFTGRMAGADTTPRGRGESNCSTMPIAGTRKTVDPITHMKAPAATWSFSALSPKSRGTAS
jgi:hypothetical protein